MGMPGSQRTVERLVAEHYVALYGYVYRLSGSEADAEDLTQETFCKAQMNLSQLREADRAKNWLFTILRNAYLHRVRTQKQQPVPLDLVGDVPDVLPESLPDVDPDQLQQALAELPEVYRTPMLLYYFEEFSSRDIAEQMDLPIATAISRLAAAQRWLRSRSLGRDAAALGPRPRSATDGL